jgi:hypothetical protein
MNLTLLYGNNTLIIRSTDRAGNFNSLTWYIVRDRPAAGPGSPWIPALAAFLVVLAVENAAIYLYWRRRGGAPPAPTASSIKKTAKAPAGPGPETEADVPEAVAEAVPPEALPVGNDARVETVDMK